MLMNCYVFGYLSNKPSQDRFFQEYKNDQGVRYPLMPQPHLSLLGSRVGDYLYVIVNYQRVTLITIILRPIIGRGTWITRFDEIDPAGLYIFLKGFYLMAVRAQPY